MFLSHYILKIWWTDGESNPDPRLAKPLCSRYHYQPFNFVKLFITHGFKKAKTKNWWTCRVTLPQNIRARDIRILIHKPINLILVDWMGIEPTHSHCKCKSPALGTCQPINLVAISLS